VWYHRDEKKNGHVMIAEAGKISGLAFLK